jgi:hypothetical protein
MLGRTTAIERRPSSRSSSTTRPLVLDRYFVHRLRMITGKDGNPINEGRVST